MMSLSQSNAAPALAQRIPAHHGPASWTMAESLSLANMSNAVHERIDTNNHFGADK
jgi:hypothetical protein